MEIRVATFEELLNSLPEDQKTETVTKDLKYWYKREVKILNKYSKSAKEPSIGLFPFNKSGDQYIAEFWVNDLAKPKRKNTIGIFKIRASGYMPDVYWYRMVG